MPKPSPKATKQPRTWPLGGAAKDISSLDYTKDKPNNNADSPIEIETNNEVNKCLKMLYLILFYCYLYILFESS